MPAAAAQVAVRPARPEDDAFLRELFLSSRPELALLEGLGADGQRLVDLQLAAQREQYAVAHPTATDHVLVVGGQRVGRSWTARSAAEVRLLDLLVHPRHRRCGHARTVVSALCAEARATRRVVRLNVWHENQAARALYTGAGFRATAESGGYIGMEWVSDARRRG